MNKFHEQKGEISIITEEENAQNVEPEVNFKANCQFSDMCDYFILN